MIVQFLINYKEQVNNMRFETAYSEITATTYGRVLRSIFACLKNTRKNIGPHK